MTDSLDAELRALIAEETGKPVVTIHLEIEGRHYGMKVILDKGFPVRFADPDAAVRRYAYEVGAHVADTFIEHFSEEDGLTGRVEL